MDCRSSEAGLDLSCTAIEKHEWNRLRRNGHAPHTTAAPGRGTVPEWSIERSRVLRPATREPAQGEDGAAEQVLPIPEVFVNGLRYPSSAVVGTTVLAGFAPVPKAASARPHYAALPQRADA